MNKSKGLTITIIFEGQSLNYDEGYGNLSVLKKMHRGNGKVYSYSSRQSLRYSLFVQGVKEFEWKPSDVVNSGSGDKQVVQIISDIRDSEESDLFGYMKTDVDVGKGKATVTRVSPVRILPAIAIEPYESDMEMLTNKYQADKKNIQPNIANIENQRSLFKYTVCIDLHRIGTESDEISTKIMPQKDYEKHKEDFDKYTSNLRNNDIGKKSKTKRVCQLLDVIGTLYRDIRGRREDLKPLFIVGGVYDTLNPFFENTVILDWKNDKPEINVSALVQQLSLNYEDQESHANIADSTFIGIRDGFFANSSSDMKDSLPESMQKHVGSPEFVISQLKNKVLQYYES
ncbi:MAG: type I-B CRISPR-associated protein Cas7/Cst2/DevR [Nitrosotalea sp.]